MLLDSFYHKCEQHSTPLYKYGVESMCIWGRVNSLNQSVLNIFNPQTLLLVEQDSIATVVLLADSGEYKRLWRRKSWQEVVMMEFFICEFGFNLFVRRHRKQG